MFQLIVGVVIVILVLFYLYLRKESKKENSPAISAPNLPAVSEDVNLPAGQAGLPAKSEDINLPVNTQQ